ncbi:glycosyltransferase [Radiobacillus deserti]|uniref:Glycosyltransferase family 4 protein n=1 Tax=Radiobacillus deserti TaxID=2594883 RepID=A0A516KD10_9BACI|nr:glycosyltransferase [Radiobacillus deserti]QDP39294.1 glycosyltransferase family 4 protein [Radiobacillus deserti]
MVKKVCMLVSEHPFLDSRIYKREAKSLKKLGYAVTMVVPRKGGYLFDIDGSPIKDKFLEKRFVHEGIEIVTYDYEESRTPLSKVLSPESQWEQGFNNPLTELGVAQDADFYHVHEYLSLFAGIGVKRKLKRKNKSIKLIYDSHELTPDPFDSRNPEQLRKNLKEKLLLMLKETDYVITISHSIKSWFLSQDPSLQVEVIYNSPPLAQGFTPKTFNKNRMVMCYEGNMDYKRGNKSKILTITDICSKSIDFHFKIIGGTRHGDSIQIPEHLKNKIELTGWVDYYAISAHMKNVDVGWIDYEDLKDSLNRSYAMPNKFFSYLNNGVPVVVNRCHEMETFIRSHRCGLVIDKKEATAEDYAKAILYLSQNKALLKTMSINARKVMEDIYSWEKMENRLKSVYDQLSGKEVLYFT